MFKGTYNILPFFSLFYILVLNLESAWLPLWRHACRLVLLILARQWLETFSIWVKIEQNDQLLMQNIMHRIIENNEIHKIVWHIKVQRLSVHMVWSITYHSRMQRFKFSYEVMFVYVWYTLICDPYKIQRVKIIFRTN